MSDKPLVSADEMASVLADDTSARPESSGPVAGSAERQFSLRRPLVIPADRELQAKARLKTVADAVAASLRQSLQSDIEIEVHGFQQQQVCAAVDRLAGPVWILGFRLECGGGVVLGLDPTTALALVELTLGGSGTYTADGRMPTPLEIRVMSNLAGILAAPLGRELNCKLISSFRIGTVSRRVAAGGEVVGAGLLRIRIASAERNGLLLITSHLLRASEDQEESEAEETSSPLAERLLDLRLETRPVLRVGTTTLRKLMRLECGAILRFPTPEQEPLELRVNGRTLFTGSVRRTDDGAEFTVRATHGSEDADESPPPDPEGSQESPS